jgi:3-methyladenine DNA glycosylase Tag
MKEHRAPWECTYAKEDKSKCKPGKKPKSEQEYFEILCLCILQAGLSWGIVRKNWKKYRRGFYNFNINKLAKISPKELMKKPDVIKNLRKIEGIIYNAKEFQKIKEEYGSFSNFLKSLKQMKDKEIFRLLMKRFRHVGEYTAEFYLHCVGYW